MEPGTFASKDACDDVPAGVVRYLEELAEGLANVGTSEEAAMELRSTLSEKHDIEVVGPPRQAGD